jgi:hypothetical protein
LEKKSIDKRRRKNPKRNQRMNPKQKLVSESKRQTRLSVGFVVMLHEENV